MARVMVKCVPDAEPDAEGTWLNRRVPAWVLVPGLYARFDLLTRHCAPEGTHVVQYRHTARRRAREGARVELCRLLDLFQHGRTVTGRVTRHPQPHDLPSVHSQDGGPMHAGFLGGAR